MNLSEWLNLKFLEWEREQGKRKTLVQFAEYLGVSRISLDGWMKNKYQPKGINLAKIASKLGYEIYDVLGIPRPMPVDVDEQVNDLIQAAMQFPPDVQAHVISVFREMIPILIQHKITDDDQIMWMMVDLLRKRIPDGENAARLAAIATRIPRIAFPVGVGFNFERTPENKRRFQEAGIAAAKKIEELGLDEDSDEGQSVILDVYTSFGFVPMDTTGMNFDAPDEN